MKSYFRFLLTCFITLMPSLILFLFFGVTNPHKCHLLVPLLSLLFILLGKPLVLSFNDPDVRRRELMRRRPRADVISIQPLVMYGDIPERHPNRDYCPICCQTSDENDHLYLRALQPRNHIVHSLCCEWLLNDLFADRDLQCPFCSTTLALPPDEPAWAPERPI